MRGVVTLAAAFAIPPTFPRRDVLVLVALVVTGGTLFIHGLSLPWLARRLRLSSPDPREDALARAALFQEASAAGLRELERYGEDDDVRDTLEELRRRVEQRDFAAWERLAGSAAGAETPSEAYARLRLEMLQAERAKVLEVRSTGRVPHEVVEDVLSALDVEESMLDVRRRRHAELRDSDLERPQGKAGTRCEHLERAPAEITPSTHDACEDCVREGTRWVHLRVCLECGHTGCCDSSPRRHATAHFHGTTHPVIRSAEPGEGWRWCFVDQQLG